MTGASRSHHNVALTHQHTCSSSTTAIGMTQPAPALTAEQHQHASSTQKPPQCACSNTRTLHTQPPTHPPTYICDPATKARPSWFTNTNNPPAPVDRDDSLDRHLRNIPKTWFALCSRACHVRAASVRATSANVVQHSRPSSTGSGAAAAAVPL
jgi:hypothetical protein